MFQRDISAGRQHAGSHKFIGGVGLLAPYDRGQGLKTQLQKPIQNSGMIRIQHKTAVNGAGGISNIDAGDAALL